MSLSPELAKEYQESTRPFVDGGGAITDREAAMHPWRVFLEVNSACNLKCPTCTKGNQSAVDGLKYEHQTGIMDEDLMHKCIDKIAKENPEAIIFLYGNSEPFLHPKLPECIAAVKQRGLRCEMSSNLNYVQRLDETLAAGLDFMIVSLSGFTQEVYQRGHAGGNIEKVKANMKLLGEANAKLATPVQISVNYHIYTDNDGQELESMKAYAAECKLGFFTSTARAISMENAIQYCREKDPELTPFAVQENRPDWNAILPPVSEQWRKTMDRLKIPPDKARAMYEKYPLSSACPIGAGGIFTFIRHDGKTELCACVADRRITIGNYLENTPDEFIQKRHNHSICQQCIKYRLNLYFMIADRELWG